jgi:hypothetical protein
VFDSSKLSVASYSSDNKVNGMYTIKVNAADAVSVANHAATASDGSVTSTNRLNLGGKGTTENRSVQINAPKAGTLKVYMMSSNATAERTVNLLDASGNVVNSVSGVNGTSIDAYTFAVPSTGTYYIASAGSGLYMFRIVYTEDPNATVQPEEKVLKGDLDKDGISDVFDIAVMREIISGRNNDSYAKNQSGRRSCT